MPDRDAAMALFAEDGWRLLVEAGLVLDDARGDALRAATALAKRRPDEPSLRRAAAMELVTEGAKLARKLGVEERLLATREAVEQASSGRVATWHAQRIPAGSRVLEIGCGCGGDSLAIAHRAANLIATDVDPVRAACAHVNLTTAGVATSRAVPGDGFEILAGEAEKADVVFVDPDRRTDARHDVSRGAAERAENGDDEEGAGGETHLPSPGLSPRAPRLRVNPNERRRTLDPQMWNPPLSRLVELARGPRRVFVKAAPSLDPEAVVGAFRVTYVSCAGECVEAFLETPDEVPHVRAVRLPADGPSIELAGDRGDAPSGPLGDAIYVVDPAAIRARLLAELCARHRLALVDPGIAFLTGPRVESPWLVGFEVLSRSSLSGNVVGACVAELGASAVRVHSRGVAMSAPDLESILAEAVDADGRGPVLDVFATRGNGEPMAVVARRFDGR